MYLAKVEVEDIRDRDKRTVTSGLIRQMAIDWLTMQAEIERLQTIVDKLPKTKDGVPVMPGEKYWCSWYDEDEEDWLVKPCRYVGHCEPHCEWDWEIEDCSWDGAFAPPGFGIYGTKEAAEAAGGDDDLALP